MRAKVVMMVAGLGLLIFGALFAFHKNAGGSTTVSNPPNETLSAAKTDSADEAPVVPKKTIQSDTNAPIPSEDAHKTYVEQRSAQLMDLAMNDDHASLDTILSELTNRDPEIRKAALEASIQFGSRDAIPKLADAASQTDDPNEKAALTEAIEFLKLPSLTEISAQSPKPAGSAHAPKPAHKITVGKRVLAPATPNP